MQQTPIMLLRRPRLTPRRARKNVFYRYMESMPAPVSSVKPWTPGMNYIYLVMDIIEFFLLVTIGSLHFALFFVQRGRGLAREAPGNPWEDTEPRGTIDLIVDSKPSRESKKKGRMSTRKKAEQADQAERDYAEQAEQAEKAEQVYKQAARKGQGEREGRTGNKHRLCS